MAKPVYITVAKHFLIDGLYNFDVKPGDEGKEQLAARGGGRLENLHTYIFKALEDLGAKDCHTREDIWVQGAFSAEGLDSKKARELLVKAWDNVVSGATVLNADTEPRRAHAHEAFKAVYADAEKKGRDKYKFFHDYRVPPINVGGPFPHISINAMQPQKAGSLGYDDEMEMRRRGLTVRDLKKEDALVVNVEIEHPLQKELRDICEKAIAVKPKNETLAIEFREASRRDAGAFRMIAVMRRNDFNALLVELGKAADLAIPPFGAGPQSQWGDVKLKRGAPIMKQLRLVKPGGGDA